MAELFLVEFQGSRREFFYNTYHHSLKLSEHVIIQAEQGEDIGCLKLKVEKDVTFPDGSTPRSILRPAGADDMQRFHDLRDRQGRYHKEVLPLIRKHGLDMKLVDVECQFDGSKITFYFTADHRVDFRALVRDLASRYRTRIELRQIGVRDEARRIGGLGICGRVQCCNSHIRDFAPITTQHARDQDLSLNPSKISGNCGRLLCCLRYEAEAYVAAKRRFPPVGATIETKSGNGVIDRIDVFNEEAIVLDAERISFRVKPSDIVTVRDAGRGKGRRQETKSNESADNGDAEQLRKLDEPDT